MDVSGVQGSMGLYAFHAAKNQQATAALALLDSAAQVGQAIASGKPQAVIHVKVPAPGSTFDTYA